MIGSEVRVQDLLLFLAYNTLKKQRNSRKKGHQAASSMYTTYAFHHEQIHTGYIMGWKCKICPFDILL